MDSSNKSEIRISLTLANDHETDSLCMPCLQEEGQKNKSVVFCLECSERLCNSCRQHHRKLKLTSTHHLLDIEDDSKTPANSSMTESCPEHPGRCIEYICEGHQSLCCKTCKDISHLGCNNIKYILDEVDQFAESGEMGKVEKSLKGLQTKLTAQFQTKKIHSANISDQVSETLNKIKTETTNAIERISKLAEEADNTVKMKSSDVKNKLQNEIDTIQNVLETLNDTQKVLTTVKQNARQPQVYIAFKKAEHQLDKYALYADEIESNMKETNVHFKFDKTFILIKENLHSVGDVQVGKNERSDKKLQRQSSVLLRVDSNQRYQKRLSSTPSISKRKKAIPVGGHSVRIPGDKTTCHVTGSEILEDGRILLADYHNKSIKLFNKNCSYISHIVLTSRPNDIVVTGEKEVATSLIDESVIQIITVNTTLSLCRRIDTGFPYHGLAYCSEGKLYGSTSVKGGTGEIHVLDITGKILDSIKHVTEQVNLVRPSAIRIDSKKHLLYINDLGRNCVYCMDISNGESHYKEVFTYTDRNLELRSGIAIDSDGDVYISSGNMTVHQISPDGVKVHEILTAADGLGLPHCLAISSQDNHLLVSEFKENSFKLFALR
ncbi:uncharacterized protein LOC132756852 [Ruditapes philippinarum]|uniref:uncharacterized protein LOC132756852 n=1 Tax=Ruditapes philippinarum TaxID=129788 RepID=UPI00295BCE33|nr:uncharacterized protein LOC132756852 [Ruditapes philippinarum]